MNVKASSILELSSNIEQCWSMGLVYNASTSNDILSNGVIEKEYACHNRWCEPLNRNNAVPCLIKTKIMDNIIYQHIKSSNRLKNRYWQCTIVIALHHSTPQGSASMHTHMCIRGRSVDQNERNERSYGATWTIKLWLTYWQAHSKRSGINLQLRTYEE